MKEIVVDLARDPAVIVGEGNSAMNPRGSRYGLILFFVYLAFYGGFVVINAFAPESMEKPLLSGLNVAIVYGFGLIIGAVVLSGIYGLLCGDASRSDSNEEKAA